VRSKNKFHNKSLTSISLISLFHALPKQVKIEGFTIKENKSHQIGHNIKIQ